MPDKIQAIKAIREYIGQNGMQAADTQYPDWPLSLQDAKGIADKLQAMGVQFDGSLSNISVVTPITHADLDAYYEARKAEDLASQKYHKLQDRADKAYGERQDASDKRSFTERRFF